MKAEQFSKALNNVSDKYIEEAAAYEDKEAKKISVNESDAESKVDVIPANEPDADPEAAISSAAIQKNSKNSSKVLRIWRAIAIAACALLIVGIGLTVIVANLSMGGASHDRVEESYGYADFFDGDENLAGSVPTEKNSADAKAGASWNQEDAEEAPAPTPSEVQTLTEENENISENLSNNKIIYRAYMDMETKEFDKVITGLEALVSDFGGFFEWAEVNNNASNYRYACYTIRIPADRLDAFLSQAGSLCTVKSQNKSAEDVSQYYYDTESRLETAKTKLARLQQLLAQAATMQDIIDLEREISDTEQAIDSYTGTLKQYDSLVDYSTIRINLKEVYKTSSENQPLTFGQKVSNSFQKGVKGFGEFLENLIVWLAQSWIWLLIAAAIIVIGIVLIKKAVRKKTNNKK